MDPEYALMFFCMSIFFSITCKNSAQGMIKKVGTKPKYFPKWYIAPKRWMKKWFGVKKYMIQKYLYLELYLSVIFVALAPISALIYWVTLCNKNVAGVLTWIYIGLFILETLHFLIMTFIFKRRK